MVLDIRQVSQLHPIACVVASHFNSPYLRGRHPALRGLAEVEAKVPPEIEVQHQVEVGLVLERVVGGADEAGAPDLCTGGWMTGGRRLCVGDFGWIVGSTLIRTSLSSASSRRISSSIRFSRMTRLPSIFMAYHVPPSGADFLTTAFTFPKPPCVSYRETGSMDQFETRRHTRRVVV